jgi:hypothetical protein
MKKLSLPPRSHKGISIAAGKLLANSILVDTKLDCGCGFQPSGFSTHGPHGLSPKSIDFFLLLGSHPERLEVLLHQIQDNVQRCIALTCMV